MKDISRTDRDRSVRVPPGGMLQCRLMDLISAVQPEMVRDCIKRAGWHKGPPVAKFIAEWAIAEGEYGRRIGPDDFVEWWREGRRTTVYRRLREFRAAFPELGAAGLPGELVEARDGRVRRKRTWELVT